MVNVKALAVLSVVLVAVVLVSGCCTCCSTDDYLDTSGSATYESPGDCSDGGDDCLLSGLDSANVDSSYS